MICVYYYNDTVTQCSLHIVTNVATLHLASTGY